MKAIMMAINKQPTQSNVKNEKLKVEDSEKTLQTEVK